MNRLPIYEFRCQSCRRRTSLFTRSIGGDVDAVCSHCGSRDMSRLISRVSVLRAGEDSLSGLDDSSLADVDENDPRSMARWVRRMSRQMGEPLGGEMEAELERMEAGEMPDEFGENGDEGFGDED